MLLKKILNGIDLEKTVGPLALDITTLDISTKAPLKNGIFVAIKGFSFDGHSFIPDAIKKGAKVICCQDLPSEINPKITYIVVKNTREILSALAKNFYNKSDEKLIKIAVTGTNGKTSTAFFIKQLLNLLGERCGLIGTIETNNGVTSSSTSHTTPEAHVLHRLFAEMVANNCKYCVMEVSSHALSLNRVADLTFQYAIFSNFTQDHLDFHKTMEDYFEAKKLLFTKHLKGTGILNIDDEKIATIKTEKLFTYSAKNKADLALKDYTISSSLTKLTLSYKGKEFSLSTRVIGHFNIYNILAASSVLLSLGYKIDKLLSALSKLEPVRGRMQLLNIPYKNVIVDYAHSPDALEKILETCQPLTNGKIYCVFGCGGDRDKTKRPIMAKVAETLADEIIVTSDNPRSEDPQIIINDICAGFVNKTPLKISDRKQAIYSALSLANSNDIIVIAGKGHESYQEIKGERFHFDDAETALDFANKTVLKQALELSIKKTKSTWLFPPVNLVINNVNKDTRTISKNDVYVAISGEAFDGHTFIDKALEKGASFAIVEKESATLLPQLKVKNSLNFLHVWAAVYRSLLRTKFIAITGTNGKTSTKEMLYTVLSEQFLAYRTPGNYNNHLGVPLTLLNMPEQTEIAVIEIGTNHPGEIAPLAELVNADMALVTNIGHGHMANFSNEAALVTEKTDIFRNSNKNALIFINADDKNLINYQTSNKITFSLSNKENSYYAEFLNYNSMGGAHAKIGKPSDLKELNLNVSGKHFLNNALAVFAISSELQMDPTLIISGLEKMQAVAGRMQWLKRGQLTFIHDAYNANPNSMKAALQTLADLPKENFKIAVLGDMLELGSGSAILHQEIISIATSLQIQQIIVFGSQMNACQSDKIFKCLSIEEVQEKIKAHQGAAIVLLKGSRGMALERVLAAFN